MTFMPDPRRLVLLAAMLLFANPVAALPEAAEALLTSARAAAARGDGIAAQAELNKALGQGAEHADVAALMGEALLLQGNPRKAREWLQPGRFAPNDGALGWRMIGALHRFEGKLVEAGQAYDRAVALAPRDPLVWVDIARMRYIAGEHLLAIEAADRALALGPDAPRALELRGQLLRDQAGPTAALEMYERGLAVAPNDLALLASYAAALGEGGRAKDMLAVARKITEIDPRSPMPFYFQAVIAARAGQFDLARSLLNRTGSRLDQLPSVMLLQGALELEAGNNTMAIAALERLHRKQFANPKVQLLYARALLATGDHTRLRQRFEVLAEKSDTPAYILTILGRSYEQTGDRVAAAKWLDRAAAVTVPQVIAIAWPDPASASVARPGSFEGLVQAGDAAFAARAFEPAFAAYQNAASVRYPDWLMLRASLALEQSGRGKLAQTAAVNYQAAFPDSMLATRLVAGSAAYGGEWQRTRVLLESLDARIGHRDVRLLADLSLAQLRSDDAETALVSAQSAYSLQRASGLAALARGMALARLGRDADLAGQLLEKAEKIGGENRLLQEARGQLQKP
jgi:cellulose synthase operon protein C